MIKLKVHSSKIGKTRINRLALVPKKDWDYFDVGEARYKINGRGLKLRVYDVPCDCNSSMHTHRIMDLRESWNDLKLTDGAQIKVER